MNEGESNSEWWQTFFFFQFNLFKLAVYTEEKTFDVV
jgi:hypothetical protein